jgi:protein subunit release factor A
MRVESISKIFLTIRVQRIPETEKGGRMHSSTAIVIIIPEVPKDFTLDEKDCKVETFRAQGAGGQHVNTTDSAVRYELVSYVKGHSLANWNCC